MDLATVLEELERDTRPVIGMLEMDDREIHMAGFDVAVSIIERWDRSKAGTEQMEGAFDLRDEPLVTGHNIDAQRGSQTSRLANVGGAFGPKRRWRIIEFHRFRLERRVLMIVVRQ